MKGVKRMEKTVAQLEQEYQAALVAQQSAEFERNYWENRRRLSSRPDVVREWEAAKARSTAADAALDAAYDAVEAVDPSNRDDDADY